MRRHILRSLGLMLAFGAAVTVPACSGQKDSGRDREDYRRSLGDSIRAVREEIDSCERNIDILKEYEDVWLRDFVTVDNPREAAPYMIFHGFGDKYPPTATGLMARLAENGQFELIASLSGRRFDRITVTSGLTSATSRAVPADQALNYMAGGLNIVMFTGPEADSIGHLVADNGLDIVSVTYLQGGPVGEYKLPNETRKMIMATFELYDTRRSINALERRLPMLHRKIDLLRAHLDKALPDSSGTE